ncbi:MAG: hypothetical protein M3Z92_01110 [Bacteroidota bacterium]|nr:hypothetical protein [Bacteroidota bacterium]
MRVENVLQITIELKRTLESSRSVIYDDHSYFDEGLPDRTDTTVKVRVWVLCRSSSDGRNYSPLKEYR